MVCSPAVGQADTTVRLPQHDSHKKRG
jgi:hypothetical protein